MKAQKRSRRFFPLLLPLLALVLAGLLQLLLGPAQMWISEYYQAREQDLILVGLETGYAVNRLLYASIFFIPLAYAAIYAISLLLTQLWALFFAREEDGGDGDCMEAGRPARYGREEDGPGNGLGSPAQDGREEGAWEQDDADSGAGRPKHDRLSARKIWAMTHIFAVVCLGIAILLSKQALYGSYAGPSQNVREARDAFQRDLANYRAGQLATYQGPLTMEGYVAPEPDKPYTGGGYYAFSTGSSNHLWLRCPKGYFSGTQLLRPSYEAKFLPGTLYAVSIVGPDGRELLGAEGQRQEALAKWAYGDVVLEKSLGIPGYDALNEGQQRLFDLLRSGVLLENLLLGGQGTYSVRLQDPLTRGEYNEASRLYRSTNAMEMENFPLYQYSYEEGAPGEAALLQIGGVDYGWRICRLYGPVFRRRAREIADALPAAGAQEACRQITGYLLAHVSPVKGQAGPPADEWAPFPETGFGALVRGAGNSKGYALAFDAIARCAGLTVQLMQEEGNRWARDGKYWNAVRLEDGSWLQIDVYTLALEKGPGEWAAAFVDGAAKGLASTRSAGNGEFGHLWIPPGWEEAAASGGEGLTYRQPGGKASIHFQRLEHAGAGTFSPAAAAKGIRAGIEARGGAIYTDFTEYLAQDCPAHLLCAAFPDGRFLATWIYAGAHGEGCSLSVYGTSENILDLYTIAKKTFSMEGPK